MVQDMGAFRGMMQEDSALQPPSQDSLPGHRNRFPWKDQYTKLPQNI